AETIRDMSHQLMPVALKKYGLKKAVQQLVTDINKSEKIYVQEVFVGFDQTDKYSEVVQVSIYRIIQELLQNIIKHSMADRAILQLIEHDDVISLMVEDNGTGIMEMGSREGKGMHLLASRIEYLEGKMNTESSEDGTLIFIEIPTKHLIKSLV
ncbi:MAG TPA: ATP-binding protein, partial [Chitinophagaceae bacterium]